MTEPKTSPSKVEAPWHSAYPEPRNSNPKAISRDELRKWLDEGLVPGKDFVLADLRRADHEVCNRNSIEAFQLLISNSGRGYSGLDQPPSAELVFKHPDPLHPLRICWSDESDLLLWCVHTLSRIPCRRTQKVVFNSGLFQGSSRGRGTRAAGWFEDYLRDQGNEAMGSYILFEGITGWAGAGDEYTRLMDEYQKEHWRK